jgi:hypothetical protein
MALVGQGYTRAPRTRAHRRRAPLSFGLMRHGHGCRWGGRCSREDVHLRDTPQIKLHAIRIPARETPLLRGTNVVAT